MARSTNDGRVTHNVSRPVGDPAFQAAAEQTIADIEQRDAPADGYDRLSKDELVAACRDRELPVSGSKPDLIARLRIADVATQGYAQAADDGGGGQQ